MKAQTAPSKIIVQTPSPFLAVFTFRDFSRSQVGRGVWSMHQHQHSAVRDREPSFAQFTVARIPSTERTSNREVGRPRGVERLSPRYTLSENQRTSDDIASGSAGKWDRFPRESCCKPCKVAWQLVIDAFSCEKTGNGLNSALTVCKNWQMWQRLFGASKYL